MMLVCKADKSLGPIRLKLKFKIDKLKNKPKF